MTGAELDARPFTGLSRLLADLPPPARLQTILGVVHLLAASARGACSRTQPDSADELARLQVNDMIDELTADRTPPDLPGRVEILRALARHTEAQRLLQESAGAVCASVDKQWDGERDPLDHLCQMAADGDVARERYHRMRLAQALLEGLRQPHLGWSDPFELPLSQNPALDGARTLIQYNEVQHALMSHAVAMTATIPPLESVTDLMERCASLAARSPRCWRGVQVALRYVVRGGLHRPESLGC